MYQSLYFQLGRLAELCAFLASDKSGYITGCHNEITGLVAYCTNSVYKVSLWVCYCCGW